MTVDDVEAAAEHMKAIRTPMAKDDVDALRTGLQRKVESPAAAAPTPAATSGTPRSERPVIAKRYPVELGQLMGLTRPEQDPRARGKQIEAIVYAILLAERLDPERSVSLPGEEIDLMFSIRDEHFFVECRWKVAPFGMPALREFSDKVRRHAVFGFALSMSGYTNDINMQAVRGEVLQAAALSYQHLVSVLEGHATWTDVALQARKTAKRKQEFYAG